ncbi:hypothetical protein AB4090_05110 [Acidithiobacillus sp. IBUN Pt1247-S3]|uniref:hypothetical protein n=1 Tax=Acidithiobacillus sp. IBUN Pt1247-S3 TaxID=3166642 RepID=UPI0034E585C9
MLSIEEREARLDEKMASLQAAFAKKIQKYQGQVEALQEEKRRLRDAERSGEIEALARAVRENVPADIPVVQLMGAILNFRDRYPQSSQEQRDGMRDKGQELLRKYLGGGSGKDAVTGKEPAEAPLETEAEKDSREKHLAAVPVDDDGFDDLAPAENQIGSAGEESW